MIVDHPGVLQLRFYQMLVEVSGEASSTIVFPVPIELGTGAGASATMTPQLQNMVQTAVALAAQQQVKKQLAAAGDKLESGDESRDPAGARRT